MESAVFALFGSIYATHLIHYSATIRGQGQGWDPNVAKAAALNDTLDLMAFIDRHAMDKLLQIAANAQTKVDALHAAKAQAAQIAAAQAQVQAAPPPPPAPIPVQQVAAPPPAPVQAVPVQASPVPAPQPTPPQQALVQDLQPAPKPAGQLTREEIRARALAGLGHRMGGAPAPGLPGLVTAPAGPPGLPGLVTAPQPAPAPAQQPQFVTPQSQLAAYEQAVRAMAAQQQAQNRSNQPATLTESPPEGFTPDELRTMGIPNQ